MKTRKLRLTRETLQNLAVRELGEVAGGVTNDSCVSCRSCASCNSCVTCNTQN